MRRKLALLLIGVLAAAGLTVLTASGALAHGAATAPGSRTYLCYQDGLLAGGDLKPSNAECAKAVATGGTQPLYDWFAVLRSDGAAGPAASSRTERCAEAEWRSTPPMTCPPTTGRPPG